MRAAWPQAPHQQTSTIPKPTTKARTTQRPKHWPPSSPAPNPKQPRRRYHEPLEGFGVINKKWPMCQPSQGARQDAKLWNGWRFGHVPMLF